MLTEDQRTRRLTDVLETLCSTFADRVTARRAVAARPAQVEPLPDRLADEVREALHRRGIHHLYTHQAEALRRAMQGQNLVITTPTASGKTLCYNLPILQALLEDEAARALYLFPTKALSRDQMAELHGLVGIRNLPRGVEDTADLPPLARIGAYVYDGDTPQDQRRAIRHRARIVLTNPDMLHSGILPHHPRWSQLFQNLRYVVLDEVHHYRGVFGSHLANVLRRLRRICAFYGSRPTFLCSSATIANAADHAAALLEAPVHHLYESGAPRGPKTVVLYNPPVIEPRLGIRRSFLLEAADLAQRFVAQKLQTIVFARSRLHVEILTRELAERLALRFGQEGLVRSYRGGYLPKERREIERGLKTGAIRCVVSTNALELGIDIGSLDVAILAGYPGTIASFWQQAGRAGRTASASAALFIASSGPLDQFLVNAPDYFFSSSPECALIHPDNLLILHSHVKCAAFELPFRRGERFGEENLEEILAFLDEQGVVHERGGTWYWTAETYPADHVSLRTVSSDNFVVVDQDGKGPGQPAVIGEVDYSAAPTTLHEKAIYLHGRAEYQVERLDWPGRKAYVRRVKADYFTDAIRSTKVRVLDVFEERREGGDRGAGGRVAVITSSYGEVHVASQVVGFKKIKFRTMENVGAGEVDVPENEMHTTAWWLGLEPTLWSDLWYTRADVIDGLWGIGYLMHHLAPLLLLCDVADLGMVVGADSEGWHVPLDGRASGGRGILTARRGGARPDEGDFEPAIILYDAYPGGMGFSEMLYALGERLVRDALRRVEGCPCEQGCPSCVGPVRGQGVRSKDVARDLLRRIDGVIQVWGRRV